MHTKLPRDTRDTRDTRDAADAELIFPSKLFEQFHRRLPPTHRTPCRPSLVGRVGRARTTGGPFPNIKLGRSTISNSQAGLALSTTLSRPCSGTRAMSRVVLSRRAAYQGLDRGRERHCH